MRDDTRFRVGKKKSNDNLEFVGPKKKSLFAQYTAQFEQKSSSQTDQEQTKTKDSQRIKFMPQKSSINYEHNIAQPPEVTEPPLPADIEDLTSSNFNALAGVTESHISRPQLEKEALKAKKIKKFKVTFGSIGTLAGIAIIAVSVMYIKSNQPVISERLRAAAGFPIYEVVNNNSFFVDKKTVTTGENSSIVYVAEQKDNNSKFIISQQAVPEILAADEQYQSFLTQTDKFASLDSKIGKAYFTKPTNIGDDISVVLKTDSTLLFIRGSGATSEEKWAQLISLLSVTK